MAIRTFYSDMEMLAWPALFSFLLHPPPKGRCLEKKTLDSFSMEGYILPLYRKLKTNKKQKIVCKTYQCGHSYKRETTNLIRDIFEWINLKNDDKMNELEINKETVRLFYEEGWNNKNFEIVFQTHDENWVHHDKSNPNDLVGGPEGNIQRMKELTAAFPDIKFIIQDIVAESDKVVIRFVATGTHQGQFGPLPATGKEVSMLGYVTHKLVNGKIVEDWVVRDTYGLLIQLGAINSGK